MRRVVSLVVFVFICLNFVLPSFCSQLPEFYYPEPQNWPQCSGFNVGQENNLGTLSGAPIGDINGDGYDDFAVHESTYVFVFFGNQTLPVNFVIPRDKLQSFDPSVKLISISGLYRITGWLNYVSPAGDVNGDGFDDFIIFDSLQESVVVVFGGPSLSNMKLHDIKGAKGFVINSNLDRSELVHTLPKSVGDVNNDGFDDIAITTTPRNPETGERIFTGYIIYGSAHPTDISFLSMDSTQGFKIVSRSTFQVSLREGLKGFNVTAAGDVNNDGFADLLVGFHPTQDKKLEGYLVYGAASNVSNADIDLSAFPPSRGSRITFPGRVMQQLGAAGDLNGDKIADFFVQADVGVFVVFGTQRPLPFNLDLSNVTNQRGIQIYGTKDFKPFSVIRSVELAGDVNGDGYDDLLVGFERVTGSSSAYVIYGRPGVSSVDISNLTSTQGWDIKAGRSSVLYLSEVYKAGDINGDGYRDIMFSVFRPAIMMRTERSIFIVYGGKTDKCVVPSKITSRLK